MAPLHGAEWLRLFVRSGGAAVLCPRGTHGPGRSSAAVPAEPYGSCGVMRTKLLHFALGSIGAVFWVSVGAGGGQKRQPLEGDTCATTWRGSKGGHGALSIVSRFPTP